MTWRVTSLFLRDPTFLRERIFLSEQENSRAVFILPHIELTLLSKNSENSYICEI